MKRTIRAVLVAAAAVGVAVGIVGRVPAQAQSPPRYEVDAAWPMPLPNRWVLGPAGAVCVDAQDHVLVLNRQEVLDVDLDAGTKAPPIIEFDQAGRVVHSWGEGLFPEPFVKTFHACHFDPDNNVWILANDTGMVRKYAHDGSKMLLQIGRDDSVNSSDGTLKGTPLNSDKAEFFVPADISIDRQTGDIYVDDGDGPGNHRIAIMDRTGKFLAQWTPAGVRSIHCMALANDGLVYVCNRSESRLQVYGKMGRFQRNIEIPWKPYTPVAPGDSARKSGAAGGAVSIALSRDTAQKWIYLINQNNSQVEIIDRRSGTILSSFGRSGHFPGDFDQPLNIAVDSKYNVYVTENRGKRVQKFRLVGAK